MCHLLRSSSKSVHVAGSINTASLLVDEGATILAGSSMLGASVTAVPLHLNSGGGFHAISLIPLHLAATAAFGESSSCKHLDSVISI
mmetsp:Transcript_16165/g.35111  ORF Transcript_16165/g.35111 Transcript_16165/m.35111 type:complete len:87 (+) Transcript_16165:108-368(+)